MADILDEMAATVEDIAEEVDETVELVDTLDEDLGNLEEDFYGDDDEDEFEPQVCHTLTFTEVSQLDITTVNDQECVIYEGYAIPINLINNYWNGKMFELPELGTIFEDNGLNSQLFKWGVER